ncbi:unnamed protein product [Prunus armeniaca]
MAWLLRTKREVEDQIGHARAREKKLWIALKLLKAEMNLILETGRLIQTQKLEMLAQTEKLDRLVQTEMFARLVETEILEMVELVGEKVEELS